MVFGVFVLFGDVYVVDGMFLVEFRLSVVEILLEVVLVDCGVIEEVEIWIVVGVVGMMILCVLVI